MLKIVAVVFSIISFLLNWNKDHDKNLRKATGNKKAYFKKLKESNMYMAFFINQLFFS